MVGLVKTDGRSTGGRLVIAKEGIKMAVIHTMLGATDRPTGSIGQPVHPCLHVSRPVRPRAGSEWVLQSFRVSSMIWLEFDTICGHCQFWSPLFVNHTSFSHSSSPLSFVVGDQRFLLCSSRSLCFSVCICVLSIPRLFFRVSFSFYLCHSASLTRFLSHTHARTQKPSLSPEPPIQNSRVRRKGNSFKLINRGLKKKERQFLGPSKRLASNFSSKVSRS